MNDKEPKAGVLGIFSSIQGEGPFMGVRQIFLRFSGCNLDCGFCDVERTSSKDFSVDKMVSIVKQICSNDGRHHSVSLTGGEPLMHKEFLKGLLPRLKETGMKIYLETNSTLTDNLRDVLELVDIVAADFKLPSSTGVAGYWDEHREFLKLAGGKDCFVKLVITDRTTEEDVRKAVDIISGIDENMLTVLQPAWPVRGVEGPGKKRLFDFLFLAEKKLNNVRIMPQMHKALGVK